jgi:hypothetical protein
VKKILIAVVLCAAGYYAGNVVTGWGLRSHFTQCIQELNVSSRSKTLRSDIEAQQLADELGKCINAKKSFVQGLFYSDRAINKGISFSKNTQSPPR